MRGRLIDPDLVVENLLLVLGQHIAGRNLFLADLYERRPGRVPRLRADRIAEILADAETHVVAHAGVGEVRCPLCLGGPGGFNAREDQGFRYPEGLRRHLTGDLNANLCAVVEAAHAVALMYDDLEELR